MFDAVEAGPHGGGHGWPAGGVRRDVPLEAMRLVYGGVDFVIGHLLLVRVLPIAEAAAAEVDLDAVRTAFDLGSHASAKLERAIAGRGHALEFNVITPAALVHVTAGDRKSQPAGADTRTGQVTGGDRVTQINDCAAGRVEVTHGGDAPLERLAGVFGGTQGEPGVTQFARFGAEGPGFDGPAVRQMHVGINQSGQQGLTTNDLALECAEFCLACDARDATRFDDQRRLLERCRAAAVNQAFNQVNGFHRPTSSPSLKTRSLR